MHRATPGTAGAAGESPPEGNRSPTRGGVSREAPGSIPDPWVSRCGARVPPTLSQAPHPAAATGHGPTWDGDSRVYPGTCRLGTRAGHPGIACRRNVGWEPSAEVRSGGHRVTAAVPGSVPAAPAPQLPGRSHGAAPGTEPPTALGCPQCSPSMAPGCSHRSPPKLRGGKSPLQD